MFNQLIESDTRRDDLARRGRFMLGTLGGYALLLACAGVASVYAYDARLGRQDLEVTLVTPVAVNAAENVVQPPTQPRPAAGGGGTGAALRDELYTDPNRVAMTPNGITTTPVSTPPAPPGARRHSFNFGDGLAVGPRGSSLGTSGTGTSGIPVVAVEGDDPRPPVPTPSPNPTPAVPTQVKLPSRFISSKVISKPVPPYPEIAKRAHVSGSVTVEILVDEAGRVISARATSGHPLLRASAERAAYQVRLTPTLLSGQPVKVSGLITYNFILQ